ncbi:MAG: hypothetical protein A2139_14295 [Desulfobacca sp. RBG_16_60_12]|nr:MAG: hypothetical protein A2139_14295 [Desulfobacca sp. RBG_16_60_12]
MKKQQPKKPVEKQTKKPAAIATSKPKKKPVKKKAQVTRHALKPPAMEIEPGKSSLTRKKFAKRPSGDWMPAFLACLEETGNVREACLAAEVQRPHVYDHRELSPEFAAAWDNAMEMACDKLAEEARRRAMEISDTLLIFLLKSHRPSVYRETYRHELTGKDGAPLPAPIIYLPANQREDKP